VFTYIIPLQTMCRNKKPQTKSPKQITAILVPLICLCFLVSSALHAQSQPPDLTAPGVIATVQRKDNTYNLGATGMRGWIWVDRGNKGPTNQMTDLSRQILVTHCVEPANAVLAVNDVILGAMAGKTGDVPAFNRDCRKAFAAAITAAEKTGAGTLRVKRWRAGEVQDVNIPMAVMGDYSNTAPFNCPKSARIFENARNRAVKDVLAQPDYFRLGFGGAGNAIALLASMKPGDDNYDEVMKRLQTYARSLSKNGPVPEGLSMWGWSYESIFLAEYYLLTKDSEVIPGLEKFGLKLAQSQSIYGTYGHNPAAFRPDGKRYSIGYGPVNAVGGTAAIGMILCKKALMDAGKSIEPELDEAIGRSTKFYTYCVGKGNVPYGEHQPSAENHGSQGKEGMASVIFGLQPGKAVEAEYFSRFSVAGWITREFGHGGQGLGYFWSALGSRMGGQEAASQHLKKVLWHLDLFRRTDGSFALDNAEQYGPGSTRDDTYLGDATYGAGVNLSATALFLLTYSLPLERLHITGKNLNPSYVLSSEKAAKAAAAGSYILDRTGKSVAELLTDIGDYDPVVRHYAAIELASRKLTDEDLTNLRGLLKSPDSNYRQGACDALANRKDLQCLPQLVDLVNDTDNWVRAKAAVALRIYQSDDVKPFRDTLLKAFIAHATNPAEVDWRDPVQISNGKLAALIFGQGVGDGTVGNDISASLLSAPKQTLLYPAMRAALQLPDSYTRACVTVFCTRNKLPLEDVQELYEDLAAGVQYDTPADRMWSLGTRADCLKVLDQVKAAETIDLSLALLNPLRGFGFDADFGRIQALKVLKTYGEAARHTLPTLRKCQEEWDPRAGAHPMLASTIEAIENATEAPMLQYATCQAESQVISTAKACKITLAGKAPLGAIKFINLGKPSHGTLSGTAPNLTYTPKSGYRGPDQFTFQTTDGRSTSKVATIGIVVGPTGNGLKGEYYKDANFMKPGAIHADARIDFDWTSATTPLPFSAKWSGALLVPESGDYQFSLLTCGAVRLHVNGVCVLDRAEDQKPCWNDARTITLKKGEHAEIHLEYRQNSAPAKLRLRWSGPGVAGRNGSIIPVNYLFDGGNLSARTPYAYAQQLTTIGMAPMPIALGGSGGTLSYKIATPPAHGTLSGKPPYVTYTATENFSGEDGFTYVVNNGKKTSAPVKVSIHVQAGALTTFAWANSTAGKWSETAKWTTPPSSPTGGVFHALDFPAAASGTYTVENDLTDGFQLNQLNMASGVNLIGKKILFVANGATLPQWNLGGKEPVVVRTPIELRADTQIVVDGAAETRIIETISGDGALIKNGSGILRLERRNTHSGGTILNAGTLTMGYKQGESLGSSPITINGGTLLAHELDSKSAIIAHGGKLAFDCGLASYNAWAERRTGDWNAPVGASWSGPITLKGTLKMHVAQCGRVSIKSNITGPGDLVAEGNGAIYDSMGGIHLEGSNNYTGKTLVTAGMLLHCASADSLGSGPVELDGGKLDLRYSGTKVVKSLTIDGKTLPAGVYGSVESGATNTQELILIGTGTLTVQP
jgi:autotransporter-associated beta strand protein